MHTNSITLHRKNKPCWKFVYQKSNPFSKIQGYIYFTKKNIYKLFFTDPYTNIKPIWIGRLDKNQECWFTCESYIRADYIDFTGTRIWFK